MWTVPQIESDRFEDDHHMDQSEHVGMSIVEEVRPGSQGRKWKTEAGAEQCLPK